MDPNQIAELAARYQAGVKNHNESLARVSAAHIAYDQATKELTDATTQLGTTLTIVDDAKAALLLAALGDVVPA